MQYWAFVSFICTGHCLSKSNIWSYSFLPFTENRLFSQIIYPYYSFPSLYSSLIFPEEYTGIFPHKYVHLKTSAYYSFSSQYQWSQNEMEAWSCHSQWLCILDAYWFSYTSTVNSKISIHSQGHRNDYFHL